MGGSKTYCDGFMVTVTEVCALTRPLLSVTFKLNVREIVVKTGGLQKLGLPCLDSDLELQRVQMFGPKNMI